MKTPGLTVDWLLELGAYIMTQRDARTQFLHEGQLDAASTECKLFMEGGCWTSTSWLCYIVFSTCVPPEGLPVPINLCSRYRPAVLSSVRALT